MKLKLFSATALAALLGMTLTPLPTNADPNCVGSECTVTFEYTGDYQSFDIPQGAKNLRFDVQGARGGRFGGLGGQVTGSLGGLTGSIYVFVGGQGSEGSNLPGGFNGGGQSGGNHADEGSGGGASDIRTTLSPQDRIVVAGGGGGTGGWSGATGGAGGGLIAAAGGSGQGGGGAPGTQTAGGAPGSSNGGYVGSAGSFGQGGTGGFSSVSGGGGGGGGWYGGGGGGADVDTCCSDGGGGGGGSSYTYPLAQNVVHAQGVRSGNGVVVLSYSLAPEILSLTLSQTGAKSAVAELVFSTEIEALPATALNLVSAECSMDITGAGSNFQVFLEDCASPNISLEILPNSVSNGVSGPSVIHFAEALLDQQSPEISLGFGSEFSTSTTLTLSGEVSGAENEITEESFSVIGCEGLELISTTPMQLSLFDCAQGEVRVALSADSFWDEWGNSAPSETLVYSIWIDSIGPEPRFSLVESTLDAALIQVSDATAGWESVVGVDLGSTSCSVDYLTQAIQVSGCEPGVVSISMKASVLADDFGNLGPVQAQSFTHEFVAAPLPEPEPVTPEPVTPEPSQSPTPTLTPQPESEVEQNQPGPVDREPGPIEPIADVQTPDPTLIPTQGDEDLAEIEPMPLPEQEVVLSDQSGTETNDFSDSGDESAGEEEELVITQSEPSSVTETELEPTESASLVQLSDGLGVQEDRPSWLLWVLIIAFISALIAGVVGYRLIGK